MSKTAKQLTNLSVKNLKAHTWLYTRLSLAFAVLVFLLCLFSAYALALKGMQNDILAEHASANQLMSLEQISGLPNGTESFVAKQFDVFYNGEEDDGDADGDDGFVIVEPTTVTVSMTVDAEDFVSAWMNNYFPRIFASDNLLTDNDRTELKRLFGLDDVLEGTMPHAANEVVLAEEFLDKMHVTGKQVLSKTVTLVISNGEDSFELSNLVVCGIIKREFNELSGHYHSTFSPYMLFSQNSPLFVDMPERVTDWYYYSLPYWLSEEEIDLITAQHECRFLGSEWLDDMMRISLMQTISTKLFVVVGGALGFSVVLMIFLMMDKLIAVFSRDCGILLSCGLQLKHVKLLLLVMLLWACLFAFVGAAILTTVGVWAINAARYSYYYLQITMSFTTVAALFGIGIVTVTLIAFLYYLYAVGRMKRRAIREFLNTSLT